jgi:hypothetical protein
VRKRSGMAYQSTALRAKDGLCIGSEGMAPFCATCASAAGMRLPPHQVLLKAGAEELISS